ncbi:MAG: tetratricopeptide repeat protein, partial [Myxococcales bacterium]|nr:tetratricopeptide repeat protein [Myxococcales bacterium]
TGGTGNVHRAIQYPLERPVALKLLRSELSDKAEVRRQFAREARSVAALNHPNITTVFDFGVTDDGALYLAMELINGESLEFLAQEGLPTMPALQVVEQVLSGLAHAHARGIVHRDLKPANILLANRDDEIVAKIVDFGIAHAAGAAQTDNRNGKVIGTPRYMSPEQAMGEQNLGPATDIYNVGLILYELAAGRHPFTADGPRDMMIQHCMAPVPRPLARPGFMLPDTLEELIMSCLHKDPHKRVKSAAECRAAIQEVREQLGQKGHKVFLPVAASASDDTAGRITLVEGIPKVVRRRGSPGMAQALEGAFVGREQTRRFLLQLIERARRSNDGSLIVLEGETGIGKTRLVTWLQEYVVERGLMKSLAGAYAKEASNSVRGLREVLEQLFGTRAMPTTQASERVVSRLLSWGMTDARDAGLLIQTLRSSEHQPQALEDDPQSVFSSIFRTLAAAAKEKPLLIVLDDLQWSGAQTAAFLDFFAAQLKLNPAPIVLLTSVRSEELNGNHHLAPLLPKLASRYHDVFVRRRLDRMADNEVAALIREVVPASKALLGAICRRSEGNPLYSLHILRYLIEQHLISPGANGEYVLHEGTQVEDIVPPSLSDLLLLRLVHLERHHGDDEPIVAVLERAAVLGSRFPYATLRAMVAADPSLDGIDLHQTLEHLFDQGLLSQVTGPEDLIDFNHGLVRDVLLKRMGPRRSTRKLHVAAANAKREFFADRVEVVASQLANHYELGGELRASAHFAKEAAVTAERMHRPAAAATAWEQFVRVGDALAKTGVNVFTEEEVSRPDAIAALANLQESLGWYDDALLTLRSLLPPGSQALASRHSVLAVLGLGRIALRRGTSRKARTYFSRGREAAARLELPDLLAESLLGLARTAAHIGDITQAKADSEGALEASTTCGADLTTARALWFMGDLARMSGDLERARSRFGEARVVFERIDHPAGVGRCLFGLALLARAEDRLDEAEELYRAALDVLEPLGLRRSVGHCFNGLGEVARFQSRFRDAKKYYRRAVEVYQHAGLAPDAATSLTNLGLVAKETGDLSAARDAMQRALQVASASDFHYLTLGIALNLAWVYSLMGDVDTCRQLLNEHIGKAGSRSLVDPDFARPL